MARKLYVRGEYLFYIILYIVAYFICLSIIKFAGTNFQVWLHIYIIVDIFLLLFQTVILKRIYGTLLQLEYLFLIIMQIFYVSQLFLVSMSYDFGTLSYAVAYIRFGEKACIYAGNYVFSCISCVYLGIIITGALLRKNYFQEPNFEEDKENSFTHYFGKALFYITAPFEIWNTILRLYTIFSKDYRSAHDVNATYFSYYLSNLFFTSLIIILCTKNNVQKRKGVFLFAIIYEFITMWTGVRAMGVLRILILFFIYYKYLNKIRIRDYLKYIPLGIIFLYVLIIIRKSRGDGISLNNLIFSVNGNILFDTFSEFSITFRVITYVLDTIKTYAYGKSILTSLLTIIPGWTLIFGNGLIDKYYTMHALELQNWGSAFASDFYFDFGYQGGVLACFVLGIIFGMLCIRLNQFYMQGNIRKFAVVAYFILEILMTTRSYIFRLPRYFAFYGIIYVLIFYISKSMYRKHAKSQ